MGPYRPALAPRRIATCCAAPSAPHDMIRHAWPFGILRTSTNGRGHSQSAAVSEGRAAPHPQQEQTLQREPQTLEGSPAIREEPLKSCGISILKSARSLHESA